MGKSINNPVMQGSTGRIGKTNFRRTVFGTVIANMSDHKRKAATANQLAFRLRAKEASAYIKARMKSDALFSERYTRLAKRGHTAFLTAYADYMKPPIIHEVNISLYNGQVGDLITVRATDTFGVESVSVKITDVNGNLIESGQALFANPTPNWTYVVQNHNSDVIGSTIEIVASDFSGASTLQEEIIAP
jgi:hypothetical protein